MDASIWDEPVAQDSPKRTERAADVVDDDDDVPQRPTKRPRQTLFLADSDDEFVNDPGPSNTITTPPLPQNINIDALFEGIDDDDDISRPLPAIVDEEELTREAEARYTKNLLTPHEILPSSSPSRDTNDQPDKKGRVNNKDDEKRARRRQLKLDENLLLSPNGFPQLVKMTKDFRIKGKGHEAADLDRLLRVYQYWTHQLYPKTTFSDTVERVEKLCHSRRMNVALSVWRDEARGKLPSRVDIYDIDESEGEDSPTRDGAQTLDKNQEPRSSPPRSSSPIVTATTHPPRSNDNLEGDDAEFWQTVDEAFMSDVPFAPPTSGPNSSMDEDEDMWGVVNEIEKEATGMTATSSVAAGPLPENHPTDIDWDDIYA